MKKFVANCYQKIVSFMVAISFVLTSVTFDFCLLDVNAANEATASNFYPSQNCIDLIFGSEGCRTTCYQLEGETFWTIGYGTRCNGSGHSNGVRHTITKEEAAEIAKTQILGEYRNRVIRDTPGILMNQNQFDALVSLAYNHGNVCDSCPLVFYLQGKLTEAQARAQIQEWYILPGTKYENGLRNRRIREANLFFTPITPIDPNAPSNIYITGYDGPQEGDVLKVGANCGIYGEIVSAHPLSKVWGGVYNRDGSKVDDYCFYSENTSVRTYSLRKSGGFNDSVIFDYLPEGFYTFKIEATDSKGYSKTVVSKNFQVGNPVVSYTVTLNPNGGTVTPTSITVSANGTYSGLTNPSKTGYTFDGWYTSDGTKKENGSSLASNSNHTLSARWTANKYKVAFNANGGSGSMGDQTLTYDQAANLTANVFKKTGYSFAGWNTKSDGSGTNYNDKASVKNLATSGTVTLYAKWSAGGYTIAYNANGGTGTMSNQSMKYDQTANLTANAFSRTGYTFAGWNTKSDGSGTNYSDKASVKNLAASGTVTLYAKWTANPYTIAFNANGGTGSMSNQSMKYDQATNLAANAFTRTGYTFAGWNTKADSSGTSYADKASVKNLVASGTITLYARWTANKYTVKFDGNGADELSKTSMEVTYNSTYGELPQPKRDGYNFIGWYTKAEGGNAITPDAKVTITEAQTLYAQWSQVKFLITFNATGGTSESAQKLVTYDKAYGVLPTAERTGYTFKGWYLDEACTQQITSDTIVSLTANQSVYAKWELVKYVITFDATGGTSERDSKQVTYGKAYGVLPSAIKDGDEFIGWFTEDGTEITSVSIVEIESDTTLYAKWASDEIVGDVNADGAFNVADVVMMQKWLFCAGGLTDWQAGDLCRDERIDGFDLCLMKRMLIKR